MIKDASSPHVAIFIFFLSISWLKRIRKDEFEHEFIYVFSMTTVENTQSLEKTTDVPKESNTNGRSTSAEFNNIQDGGHVESSILTSSLQPNSVGALDPSVTAAQVGECNNFSLLMICRIKRV